MRDKRRKYPVIPWCRYAKYVNRYLVVIDVWNLIFVNDLRCSKAVCLNVIRLIVAELQSIFVAGLDRR